VENRCNTSKGERAIEEDPSNRFSFFESENACTQERFVIFLIDDIQSSAPRLGRIAKSSL